MGQWGGSVGWWVNESIPWQGSSLSVVGTHMMYAWQHPETLTNPDVQRVPHPYMPLRGARATPSPLPDPTQGAPTRRAPLS